MISGKNKNFYRIIPTAFIALLYSACPIFGDDINLPNPAAFEPAQIKTTAEINTETSRNSESRNIPASDIPIPEIVNSFFAPVEELEELEEIPQKPSAIPADSPFKQIDKTQTTMENKPPAQKTVINTNKILPEFGDNPFKIMDNIVLPSQYKINKKTNIIEDAVTQKNTNSRQFGTQDQSYVSSVIEDFIPHENDYEGLEISNINFKGLFYIKESILTGIIKTREGALFNSQNIEKDLQSIYALGYFTDSMYVEPELKKNGTVSLTFVLEENITVKKVEIVGNTVFKDSELRTFVKKLEGLPQNLNLINETIEQINKYYEENGYILAKVSNVDDKADGKLTFVISEGIIEKINLEGNEKTKDYIIERNILTKPGNVYNENYIKKDLAKIYSTQIFEKVDRIIEPSKEKDGEYIVTVKVKESSSNNVSIGLGVDNALGGFGSISFNEKNLFGRNQKFSISGMLGSGLLLSDASIKNKMNWNLEMNFFEPYFINENNTFASKIFYRDLGSYQIPLAIERRWGFNNTLEHKVRGYDNLSTNLALGYEYIHLKEGDLNKITEMYRRSNIDFMNRQEQLKAGAFFNISPGVKYSTLDDENMPREGFIAKANLMEAVSLSSSRRTNGRLIGSITKYIPIAKKSTLLIGAKGGFKVHGSEMPEVMAFRLGGPYTIRGFRMNGVGTGESFMMASTELQTPIPFADRCKFDFVKNLRFAFFVDAGKIYDPTITSKLYDRPLSAITAGVGLRINIPGMSTITVDYGLPLTNTGHYSSQHGYFTFGTGGLYDSY